MAKTNITFCVEDERLKQEAKQEAELRGETLSEAMAKILKLGLPIYKKTVKPKYTPVESAALAETVGS